MGKADTELIEQGRGDDNGGNGEGMSRRGFLRGAGLVGAGIAAGGSAFLNSLLAGCDNTNAAPPPTGTGNEQTATGGDGATEPNGNTTGQGGKQTGAVTGPDAGQDGGNANTPGKQPGKETQAIDPELLNDANWEETSIEFAKAKSWDYKGISQFPTDPNRYYLTFWTEGGSTDVNLRVFHTNGTSIVTWVVFDGCRPSDEQVPYEGTNLDAIPSYQDIDKAYKDIK